MADNYIDYLECLEYGGHFMREGRALIGASPVVNMNELLARVGDSVNDVAAELDKAGVKASELRGERGSMDHVVAIARATLHSFFHHLRVQRVVVFFDFEAFFARQSVGPVARLEPSDLLGKMDTVLRGFAAPGNASLPGAAEWQQRISEARDALAAAVTGRGAASVRAIHATTGLVVARRRFLTSYRLAKRIVRALLDDIGRGHELTLFFLDMTVNESGPGGAASPDSDDSPDGSDRDGSDRADSGKVAIA